MAEDEASLYIQATTTTVWAPVGQTPVARVATQRDSVKFYGSLDLCTGQEVVTRVDAMNSEATAEHLKLILATYPERSILLFWDRATWHGGDAVREVLNNNPRLEIVRFPPGSPDLNPQEHVWKAARIACSHNHACLKLSELADRFEHFLRTHLFNYAFLERFNLGVISAISK